MLVGELGSFGEKEGFLEGKTLGRKGGAVGQKISGENLSRKFSEVRNSLEKTLREKFL